MILRQIFQSYNNYIDMSPLRLCVLWHFWFTVEDVEKTLSNFESHEESLAMEAFP